MAGVGATVGSTEIDGGADSVGNGLVVGILVGAGLVVGNGVGIGVPTKKLDFEHDVEQALASSPSSP